MKEIISLNKIYDNIDKLVDTGEHSIPGTSRITELESEHRYFVAADLSVGKNVIDIASGEGYGAYILSQKAKSVIGVDINKLVVEYANDKYQADNLKYVVGNVTNIPVDDDSVDVVISFETIEHIGEQQKFLAEIFRVLKPDGLLILSSPNKTAFQNYQNINNENNRYHIKELEQDELLQYIKLYFDYCHILNQNSFYNSIIEPEKNVAGIQYFVRNEENNLVCKNNLNDSQYSLIIASNRPLPAIKQSCFLDAIYQENIGFFEDDEAVINQFGLRGKLNDMQKNIVVLNHENAIKNDEVDNLTNRLKVSNNSLSEAKNEYANVNEKKMQLQTDQAQLEKKLEITVQALSEAKNEYANVNEQKMQLQTKFEKLEDSLQMTQQNLVNSNNKNQQLRETNNNYEKIIDELKYDITQYIASQSYRYTRWLAALKRNKLILNNQFFHKIFKSSYKLVPVNEQRKIWIKNWFYNKFGYAFKNIKGYQNWQAVNNLLLDLAQEEDSGLFIPDDIPLTSVIIPVYNNLELTSKCLNSIYTSDINVPYEVIVVDDCSSDDLQSLQKSFHNLTIIKNDKNLGFLRTSNCGAKHANGEYLLFLNNDTEVLDGWLDELAVALYSHQDAGVIGSQLIYMSTGKLQESGNLICRDGSIIPLGRGHDPNHCEYAYFKEVDFCSAASIIVKKEDFDGLGGFDEIYAPAYYEDPDLAFKLRDMGKKNYVMPLSRVLHHEMASYGATLDESCDRNRKLFIERWTKYINNAIYGTVEDREINRQFTKKRIFYLDAQTPMPDRGSGDMDAIFFMKYMIKRNFHVSFHGEYTPGYSPKYTAILLRMGVECIYAPYHLVWEYLASAGFSFSYLFVSRVYQAQCFDKLFKQYCSDACYIFNTVDLHFVREEREAAIENSREMAKQAKITKHLELMFSQRADATIVISSEEKQLLNNEYNLDNIYYVPQAREVFECKKAFTERDNIVFVGSAHPPNLDGLKYFHDDILPLLLRKLHDIKITIIGEALANAIKTKDEYKHLATCKQFKFVGFVQDLDDHFKDAKLSIAPLRYGAGAKGKVASSMGYGVPCVTTYMGTEGTGMLHNENVMIAKTADEFVDCIVALCSDQKLWEHISQGGIQFLYDNYSIASCEEKMDIVFNEALQRTNNRKGQYKKIHCGNDFNKINFDEFNKKSTNQYTINDVLLNILSPLPNTVIAYEGNINKEMLSKFNNISSFTLKQTDGKCHIDFSKINYIPVDYMIIKSLNKLTRYKKDLQGVLQILNLGGTVLLELDTTNTINVNIIDNLYELGYQEVKLSCLDTGIPLLHKGNCFIMANKEIPKIEFLDTGGNCIENIDFQSTLVDNDINNLMQLQRCLEYDKIKETIEHSNKLCAQYDHGHFTVGGHCDVCDEKRLFNVSRLEHGLNEEFICCKCHLNNRQRLMFSVVKQYLKLNAKKTVVYVMEQVTVFFAELINNFKNEAEFIGSEFIDVNLASGLMKDGIRHENIENLSFENNSIDLIVSNHVFEHVNDPYIGFKECVRVLRPDGQMFLTIPFDPALEKSFVRAKTVNDKLEEYADLRYHGDPLSEDGCLVNTDFGWDILSLLKQAGFKNASMSLYTSKKFVNYGDPGIVIVAQK